MLEENCLAEYLLDNFYGNKEFMESYKDKIISKDRMINYFEDMFKSRADPIANKSNISDSTMFVIILSVINKEKIVESLEGLEFSTDDFNEEQLRKCEYYIMRKYQ